MVSLRLSKQLLTSGSFSQDPNICSVALCLSVFLVALDNSIIATPIPKITDEFHSIDDIGWYGSGE